LVAVSHVVGLGLLSVGILALISGLDVLGLSLVEVAVLHVGCEDSNVDPWRRSPVWEVISLLSTLVSVSVGIVVLSGVGRGGSSEVSVVDPQSHVSLSSLASNVVGIRLVHSVERSIILEGSGSSIVGSDGVGGLSISQQEGVVSIGSRAHVLNNHVADKLSIDSTSVLCGPLKREERTLIKAHGGSNAISSLCVVLGIEQSVGIVSIGVGLIESIIRSSEILHVEISIGQSQEDKQSSDELHRGFALLQWFAN